MPRPPIFDAVEYCDRRAEDGRDRIVGRAPGVVFGNVDEMLKAAGELGGGNTESFIVGQKRADRHIAVLAGVAEHRRDESFDLVAARFKRHFSYSIANRVGLAPIRF